MTSTKALQPMHRQQVNGSGLRPTQTIDPRMQRRRLASAFLAIPRHLETRPEPRHVFDNVARADNAQAPKGADLVEVCQSVMRAAVATKDQRVIEETQGEILAYIDLLASQCLEGSPVLGLVAFPEAAIDAVEEMTEAPSAVAKAGITKDPNDMDRAAREVDEADRALDVVRSAIRRIPSRHLAVVRS